MGEVTPIRSFDKVTSEFSETIKRESLKLFHELFHGIMTYQENELQRLMPLWHSEWGDPVVVMSDDGQMLGLASASDMGTEPAIRLHARPYVLTVNDT